MEMFEQASRLKTRWPSAKGQLSAEELWDLPLKVANGTSLNSIAVALHQQMQQESVSFVDTETRKSMEFQLRFDIVRHIIRVKLEEKAKAENARAVAEQNQKILGIIARKEDAELEALPIEELRKKLGK